MNRNPSREDDDGQGLAEIVDTIDETASDRRKVSVGTLLDAFGSRAYGPLLLVPALLAASPVGVIPGVAVGMATLIALVAGQIAFGRQVPWIPAFLRNIAFKSRHLHRTAEKSRKAAHRVDRIVDSRLEWLTGWTALRVVGALCVVLAALIYPLALVPLGVLMPAGALILLGLAVSAHDGLLMLVALTLSAAALIGSAWLLLFG